MAKPRHLLHAPITEAVIDFRAHAPAEIDVKSLATLAPVVGSEYGPPKGISLFEFGWSQAAGSRLTSQPVDDGVIGFRYETADGRHIAQFRKDGFTFSRLAPYTEWEAVFSEASRLYRIFVEAGHPEEVTRIAVRYINRLLLPEEQVGDFSPFLAAPPPLPKEISSLLTNFLTRVQVRDPATGVEGTITQTIQQGAVEPNKVPVILDLDFFELGSRSPAPEAVLPRFATLREHKNKYFFASITEATADLYT